MPTLTLQPDATDGKDTWLNSNYPPGNYGTGTRMLCGRDSGGLLYAGLLQFDLSGLPAEAVVTAATLTLTEQAGYAGAHPIYRVLPGNAWTEAQATWAVRQTATAWAGAAGCLTAGVDVSATPIGIMQGSLTPGTALACVLDLTEFAAMRADNLGLRIGELTTGATDTWHRAAHATW